MPASAVPTIDRRELAASLRGGRVTLVDVLSPESFAAFHLPGATNLPIADLERLAPRLLPDRHARIVTYCGGPT